MIRLIIGRGIEVAVLVLTKAKKSYGSPASPSQTIKIEFSKGSPIADDD